MTYALGSFLNEATDFRRAQGQRYPLRATLAMIILAILDGANGYREFARFMKHHQELLVEAFALRHGVPSHVTIRTILRGLDLKQLSQRFFAWMQPLVVLPPEEGPTWLSADGKSMRSTVANAGNALQNFVSVVSLFAHHSNLVLAQQEFQNKKSHEPEVVRHLIEQLQLRDVVLVLDALHCKKKTLELILNTHNHFLIQVKRNTPALYQAIAEVEAAPIDSCTSSEQGRGRLEHRHVQLYDHVATLPKAWPGIQRLIKVRRWGQRQGQPYEQEHYYICSLPLNEAQVFAQRIRDHWKIENALHWTKDVQLREDRSTIRQHQPAAILSLLNSAALNLLRLHGFKPTKDVLYTFTRNVKELINLVRT